MKKQLIRNIIIASLAVLLLSVLATVAILAAGASTQTYGETLGSISANVGGKVSLKFTYKDLGTAEHYVTEVYNTDGTLKEQKIIGATSIVDKTITVALTPSEMANTVKVYPATVENGEITARGEGKSYSVREYALAVIASDDPKHTPHHNTMRALLNWGAMAEKTISGVASPLANVGLYTRDTNPIDGVADSFATVAGGIVDNSGSYGCVLTLDIKENIFNFYFTGLADGEYTAYVSKDGGEAAASAVVEDTVSVEGVETDAYKVGISNVGIAVYDKTYKVEIKDENDKTVISANGNVLYYLDQLAFATGTNAKYNDIAKSMYQLYTLAMNKTAPTSCKHAESHLRNAEDTSYLVECSICFSELSGAIDNKIDMYSLGNNTDVAENKISMDVEHVVADGTNPAYTRFDNLQVAADTPKTAWPWARLNIVNSETGIENGRYLVFRYRLSTTAVSAGNNNTLNVYVSSSNMKGNVVPATDKTQIYLTNTAEGTTPSWRTAVIDLWQNAVVDNYNGALDYNAEAGTATVKLIQFELMSQYKEDPNNADNVVSAWKETDFFDLAYVAVVDDFADVSEVIKAEGKWDYIRFSYAKGNVGTQFCKYSFGEIAPSSTPDLSCNGTHKLEAKTINGQDALACACGYAEKTCVHNYVKYSITGLICSKCGVTSENTEPHDSLKVLAIGNSFSEDATTYLWSILKEAGINDVTVANMYIGGATVGKHNTNFANDTAAYTYQEYTSATMVATENHKLSEILAKGWDIVILQQASAYTGRTEDYSGVPTLVENVKKALPDCQLYWHMTWAYQNGYKNDNFANFYGSNQMTMYNGICTAVQANIVPNNSFVGIIPTGTTIQNLRTSYLGDTLTRDGYHMSYDIGRYAVALTWAAELGVNIDDITYAPDGNNVTDATPAIKEAVKNAVAENFKVTESTHKMAPWVIYKDAVKIDSTDSFFNYNTGNVNSMTATLNTDDGGFVRLTAPKFPDTILRSKWPYSVYNLVTDTSEGGGIAKDSAKYIVFKYRISGETVDGATAVNYIKCLAGNTQWVSGMNLFKNESQQIKVTRDGNWHTVVIDLSVFNTYNTGTGNLTHFWVEPFLVDSTNCYVNQFVSDSKDTTATVKPAWQDGAYMDFAYVAVCGQYSDLAGIIDQSTYDFNGTSYNTSDISDTAPTS